MLKVQLMAESVAVIEMILLVKLSDCGMKGFRNEEGS